MGMEEIWGNLKIYHILYLLLSAYLLSLTLFYLDIVLGG